MIPKFIFFTTALILVSAQHYQHENYGHQHGLNVQPAYHQPIAIQSAPAYVAPISHYVSPAAYNFAPHRYAPIASVTPVRNNIAPFSHRVTPLTYHAGPIIQQAPATVFRRVSGLSNYASPAVTLQHSNNYNQNQYAHGHQEYHAYPKYEYEYSVHDTHTGDIKSQHEARDGDHVTGFYSLHEPDGSVRTVHYNVAGQSGFNARVEQTGHSTHAQPIRHYATQYPLAHHR